MKTFGNIIQEFIQIFAIFWKIYEKKYTKEYTKCEIFRTMKHNTFRKLQTCYFLINILARDSGLYLVIIPRTRTHFREKFQT